MRPFIALCVAIMHITPICAETREVDVALVLAVDESNSVDAVRWQQQMIGYAEAFRDPSVQQAITSGPNRCIIATMVVWSEIFDQKQAVPWTILCTKSNSESFARSIDVLQRTFQGDTAIAAVIDYSTTLLRKLPVKARRKVIDISGDGPDNRTSGQLMFARHQAVKSGIVINGLPIVTMDYPKIAAYYEQFVIGGDDSFIVVADSFDDFAVAIRRKLILEIATNPQHFAMLK